MANRTLLYTVSAIVQAPPAAVWLALLAAYKPLSEDYRRRLADSPNSILKTTSQDPATPDATIDIHGVERRIALEGQWWYRGEHVVEPHPQGSRLTYHVYNAAPALSAWAVPLMQRNLPARMRADLKTLLRAICTRLDCVADIEG